MRDEEAYREHSCLHNTMDSRRDLNGRGKPQLIVWVCGGRGEYEKEQNGARDAMVRSINHSKGGDFYPPYVLYETG